MFGFTSCEPPLVSEICVDIGDNVFVFIVEGDGVFIFSGEVNDVSVLDGDSVLLLSDLFDIFFTFRLAAGLISSTLPFGFVRIISRRPSSDICLIPKLLA
jgi:hypothetical protein